jgi:UDP-N-acetylmuramoyl-tripeptide--D-alanyl-D-alanine ligase
MPLFRPEDLARWSAGTWTRLPRVPIKLILHDTRAMEAGALFVAIAGERVDGHTFLPALADVGAAGALCVRGRSHPALPCLEVEDPLAALRAIAREYRRHLGGLMIGVTGSAGKTTVKELLAAILAQRGDTCRTRGNWNNDIGLPLSLLRMEESDDFGVFELGMNHAGEIAALARILEPICGIVTSIGAAHLEALGTLEAIAQEKGSLLAALPPEGVALIDLDSPYRDLFRSLTPARVVTCSLHGPADYQGGACTEGLRVVDQVRGLAFELPLPLPGEHMMRNLLQATAIARECGLSPAEIRAGIEAFAPPPMRWESKNIGSWTVINDAYNANPLSMRGALQTLADMSHPQEKWVVLGGMNELGPSEKELHREIGTWLSRQSFAGLIAVGEKATWVAETSAPLPTVCVAHVEAAAEHLRRHAGPGAVILLKASRTLALEKILPLLTPSPSPHSTP